MLNHIDAHMKSFIKTEECRRKTLLNHFESVSLYPEQPHLCCDNCAAQCKCGMPHSDNITKYPVTAYEETGGNHCGGGGGGKQYSFFGSPEICPCQARMKSFYSLTIYIVVGK